MLKFADIAFGITFVLCCLHQAKAQTNSQPNFNCATQQDDSSVDWNFFQLRDENKLWTFEDLPKTGSTPLRLRIGVWFVNGTLEQRKLVKEIAAKWVKNTAIEWVFDNLSMKQIRIEFSSANSWSRVGTEAIDPKLVAPNAPTMRLQGIDPTLRNGWNEHVILHEFGHALGLKHEMQHPAAGMKWVTSEIYLENKGNGWCNDEITRQFIGDVGCLQKIENFITLPLHPRYICPGAIKFDNSSVMMYPIPAKWLRPNKSSRLNYVLSRDDLACALSLYPRRLPICKARPRSSSTERVITAATAGFAINSDRIQICAFYPGATFWSDARKNGFAKIGVTQSKKPAFVQVSQLRP